MTCEKCGLRSNYLDEVGYYDINGTPLSNKFEIECYAQDTDALAYKLCEECAYTVFNEGGGVLSADVPKRES